MCVFPIIKAALDEGAVSVKSIAALINDDEFIVIDKLSGNNSFDINEAMAINEVLFPDIPFKLLFTPVYES